MVENGKCASQSRNYGADTTLEQRTRPSSMSPRRANVAGNVVLITAGADKMPCPILSGHVSNGYVFFRVHEILIVQRDFKLYIVLKVPSSRLWPVR